MSEKLEACPFCGGEASLTIPSEHVQADYADIYVSCDECEVEGQHFVVEIQDRTPDQWPYEQRDAIAAWNNRTPANGEQVERVPFGYWIEQKGAEPALLRKPAYIPEPSNLRTVTPLYTLPTPTQDARERVKVLEEAAKAVEGLQRQVPYEYNRHPCSTTMKRAAAAIRALGNQEQNNVR